MMREEIFQLHVATPTYATCPMSLYKTRDKLNMVFFPCWYTTGSFSAGMQQSSYSANMQKSSFPSGAEMGLFSLLVLHKFLICHGNQKKNPKKQMTTGHETHKLGRQSSNDHNCQYGSHHITGYGENAI